MSNESSNKILISKNSKNFKKLRLSQEQNEVKDCNFSAQMQPTCKTLSQPLNWNTCLSKPYTASLENTDEIGENNSTVSSLSARQLRVKSLDQLRGSTSECRVMNQGLSEEHSLPPNIIDISSDEESHFKMQSRSLPASRRSLISRKKIRKKMPLSKDEKIVVARKLTKSTNLKTFPRKYMPADQRSISDYFKVTKTPIKVGYFETVGNSCIENETMNKGLMTRKSTVLNEGSSANAIANNSEPLIEELSQDPSKISIDNTNDLQMYRSETKYTNILTSSKPRECELLIYQKKSNESLLVSPSEELKDARIRECVNDSISLKSSNNTKPTLKIKSEKLSLDLSDVIDLTEIETFSKSPTTEFKDSSSINSNVSKRPQRKCNVGKSNIVARKRKKIECPSYKIIENTTFAVDAFRFGEIEGVTHYFLTHFHADHYMGLTKKFSKPIYLSAITAKLVAAFIRTSAEFLHIVDQDTPITVNGVEVIALDANHCPGALMFLFKFSNGLCTLHTGDFRASPDMEEGPFLWNNSISTLYLDTTYLSSKYAFKPQCDTILDAISAIDDFREKHIGEKILYIFGSYVIGKEKIWSAIAETYKLHVWTEGNRRKALEAIGNRDLLKYLVDDPHNAQMHILSMGNMSYHYLLQYLDRYNNEFDVLFAIRASGWEKNSKPQYRHKINIIGIEYSEHSSYEELRRFVYYLQPSKIISTVPIGSCVSKTSKIPACWLNTAVRSRRKGYQTSISNFVHIKDSRKNLPRSTVHIINEIDDAKFIDSSEDLGMLDATFSKESIACELVSDWML